jgi:hypothetical protein
MMPGKFPSTTTMRTLTLVIGSILILMISRFSLPFIIISADDGSKGSFVSS